jgi:hypothetical protein
MKNNNFKPNRALLIAVTATFLYSVVGRFVNIHDFFRGFLVGISIVGYSVGIYGMSHDLSKLKEFKQGLFHR